MLQIKHISKEYRTGGLVQKALDDVSLNLRDNEFVAILGPSGSGKTTLLNIIGGLDQYDEGDLIINGISTKAYKDRDWDSYRNHTIGFVFQSYNLIPHQTLLSNVELALTISGISKSERKKRAKEALEQVGLGDHINKRPNQLSGGQMQRVAIARALVNNPDILLADEPTGALDSNTSVQVMDLLKEVAKDRLVVMVTHNPELAEEYATRIVNLKDGHILSDSNPLITDGVGAAPPVHKNMGKASMSFLTALALSFNNLRTKKARTLLTAFAGSIGIIGIALILALSNGVNDYIIDTEEKTLAEYPLQITSSAADLSSMMEAGGTISASGDEEKSEEINVIQTMTSMFSSMSTNDLASLKTYLESGKSDIKDYVSAIEYKYDVEPQIYLAKEDAGKYRKVNPDQTMSAMGMDMSGSIFSSMMSTNSFYALPANESMYVDQYDVKAGRWPKNSHEMVLVLTSSGDISDFTMYALGLRDGVELDTMIKAFMNGEDAKVPENMGTYNYEDILGKKYKLVNAVDYYEYDGVYGIWKDKTDNTSYMTSLVANGDDLEIVGIVQPKEDATSQALMAGIYYPDSLITYVVNLAEESDIVKDQLANRGINVFTGDKFGEESDNAMNMDSLFSMDENALSNLFDPNALNLSNLNLDMSNMDLSNMDLSNVDLDLDLAKLLSSVEFTGTSEDIQKLAEDLLKGFQEYGKTHPEADYSNVGEGIQSYLSSDEARQILLKNFQEIMGDSNAITVTTDDVAQLMVSVLEKYQSYAAAKGYDISENPGAYLAEYLGTQEAQAYLQSWIDENLSIGDITISEEQISKLGSDLSAGYVNYSKENGYGDLSKLGDYFMDYVETEDAQAILTKALSNMLDTSNVEKVLGESLSGLSDSLGDAMSQALAPMMTEVMTQMMSSLGDSLASAINVEAFQDAFQFNMDADDFMELMMSMNSSGTATYDSNLSSLGYADFGKPIEIDIYPMDFPSKEHVVEILDQYNESMREQGLEDRVITYTDLVGTLMSSVTDIINMISYVLIAFVGISLVVSSIMIGVITYISVLERQKEIGILRAIGASKRNVSQIFNAETFIIGLFAGLLGVGLAALLTIPANALIRAISGASNLTVVLPIAPAVVLVLLSIVLTMLGGLIPSRKAAKSDPVTALRTE